MILQRGLTVCGAALAALLAVEDARGFVPMLAPGDAILSIDTDVTSRSFYPGGEPPTAMFDGNSGSKYLNFGQRNSGFIVTPTTLSSIGSFIITTANDATERDPVLWEIAGTNDPITSADNSAGDLENWAIVASGTVTLPDARQTLGPVVTLPGAPAYSSYRVVFPSLKDNVAANSLQIGEFGLFSSVDGSGSSLLATSTPTLAIHRPNSESRYPGGESPNNLLDGNAGTKFLNFGRENVGVIVTPSSGAAIIGGFEITTANDFAQRDPASYRLYGTNDAVLSENNSAANGGEVWTLLSEGALSLPGARLTSSGILPVANSASYASYRIEFPTIVGPSGGFPGDSLQIGGLQLYSVPEPTGACLAALMLLVSASRRRKP